MNIINSKNVLNKKTKNILDDFGYYYGIFNYKNTIPVLIYSNNDTEARNIKNDFNNLFILNFNNKQTTEEFEKYRNAIKHLTKNDISFVLYKLSKYKFSTSDETTADIPENIYADNDIIKNFYDNCCIVTKDKSFITTQELFDAYLTYAYKHCNVKLELNSSSFSKKFKKITNAYSKQKADVRGYEGIVLKDGLEKLSDEELSIIKETKQSNNISAFDRIINELKLL